MKDLKIIASVFGLLILLGISAFAVAGIALPADVSFTNEVEINAAAERVWQVIKDKNEDRNRRPAENNRRL